ncbi:MAG: ABC transporter ATP-binding protein [Bacteriovoracaceae bacterium]|nr:ABC transporter ATP-binding protein [Bacteriovoracaceae bacterium]
MSISKIKWFDFFKTKGFKFLIMTLVACLIMASILGAIVPNLMKDLGDNYANKSNYNQSLINLLMLFIAIYINRIVYQLSINYFIRDLVQNVRKHCYSKWILRYDVQKSRENSNDEFPLGEVIARLFNDTEAIRELLTSGTFGILIDLFFVVSCLISFVTLNLIAGSFLMILEILAAIFFIWTSRYMRTIFLKVRTARGNVSKAVANVVGGVNETFFTNHRDYASRKCETQFDHFLKIQLISNFWDASYYSMAESMYPILLAAIVFIFPYSHIAETAIIITVMDLIQRSIGPIKDIASKIANVQRAFTGFTRITEFLEHLDKGDFALIKDDHDAKKEIINELYIDIKYFSYGQKENQKLFELKEISFSARRGELIGLVGLSGSGKSTLFGVIAGNIIPEKAELTLTSQSGKLMSYPGKDLQDIIHYREQVGLVSQDSHVFTESLEFNITLSEQEAEKFKIFWEFMILEMEYLRNWKISPRDIIYPSELSIGQKQLIAGVRACYQQKPLVLFDEISSGLDSSLEKALRKVVLLVQKNSITMIVAHRLETIIAADCIHVLESGRLISSGNHQDLVRDSLLYREFMEELSHS